MKKTIGYLFTIILVLVVLPQDTRAASCTITVTSERDDGAGSATTLREAIQQANASPNADVLCFAIGSNYKTIIPQAELPMITQPVIIDGLTQPRDSTIGAQAPVIEIAGTQVAQNTETRPGLYITSSNVTIRGLIINRFEGDGVIATHGGSSVFEYNYIGTNSAGTIAYGNGRSGIGLQTSNNKVRNNLVSGNSGAGIAITGTGSIVADGNSVTSNRVGTDITGLRAIPNASDGILLTDSGNNTIGGTAGVSVGGRCTGECNLFSGNGANGIGIQGVESLQTAPTATNNRIIGNYVGVDIDGLNELRNYDIGFEAQDAPNNIVGGTTPVERNIFSGNGGAGVSITSTFSYGNVIQGNYIGVDRSGMRRMANHKMGVNLGSPFGGSNNSHDNMIGGTAGVSVGGACTGSCNVISGNDWSGVFISGNTGGNNQIVGNFIGPGVSGGHNLGNKQDGVGIVDSSNNKIGGPAAAARNLISGNGYNAVVIVGVSSGTRIEGNYLGLGTDTGCMPNGETGVTMRGGTNTAVLTNSIDCNGKLGIDIGPDRVSMNDAGDRDGGPNNTQNFPVIDLITRDNTGLQLKGVLNSNPGQKYLIELFANDVCDLVYLHGEGRSFITSTTVDTDGNGNAYFSIQLPTSASGKVITATATKYYGSTPYETSEFSGCRTAPTITTQYQHPDGTIVRNDSTGEIFLVEDSTRRRIGSVEVLNSYNISASEIRRASSKDLALQLGSPVYFKEGALVRPVSRSDVYVIDWQGGAYYKRRIPSASVFSTLGYTSNDVIVVQDTGLQIPDGIVVSATVHPEGTAVKPANSSRVSLISSTGKIPISSPAVLISHRITSSNIKLATSSDLAFADTSPLMVREGAVVMGSAATIYVIDEVAAGSGNYQKRPVNSMAVFDALGYTAVDILRLSDAELPATTGPSI